MYVQFTSCVYKVADLRFSCLDRPEGFWDTAQKAKKKIFRIAFSAGLLRATASETRKYVPKLFSSFSEKYKISLRCFVDVIVYLLEILEK